MVEVEVYTTDYCPYCKKAKALLDKKGVSYAEIDVTGEPDFRTKLAEMTGGKTTVPQVFINGKSVGGSSDLENLNKTGELDKILSE